MISESKRFLGNFKLNPYCFSTTYKDPDDTSDIGFTLKSVDMQLAQGPIDNFLSGDLDTQFKSQYLKFQRCLHSLSSKDFPHIPYDGNSQCTSRIVSILNNRATIRLML